MQKRERERERERHDRRGIAAFGFSQVSPPREENGGESPRTFRSAGGKSKHVGESVLV